MASGKEALSVDQWPLRGLLSSRMTGQLGGCYKGGCGPEDSGRSPRPSRMDRSSHPASLDSEAPSCWG